MRLLFLIAGFILAYAGAMRWVSGIWSPRETDFNAACYGTITGIGLGLILMWA